MSRRSAAILLCAWALWAWSPAAGADPVPQPALQAVQGLVDGLDRVLADPELSPASRRALLERELESHLDFGVMTAVALGPLAKQVSHESFAALAQEYERFLTHRYIQRLAGVKGGELELEAGRFDAEKQSALFRVLGPDRPTLAQRYRPAAQRRRHIDMTLRQRHGQWRVVSVATEGVDMSVSFREQFQSFLSHSDPDALLAMLREKNAEADAENPFEE